MIIVYFRMTFGVRDKRANWTISRDHSDFLAAWYRLRLELYVEIPISCTEMA